MDGSFGPSSVTLMMSNSSVNWLSYCPEKHKHSILLTTAPTLFTLSNFLVWFPSHLAAFAVP